MRGTASGFQLGAKLASGLPLAAMDINRGKVDNDSMPTVGNRTGCDEPRGCKYARHLRRVLFLAIGVCLCLSGVVLAQTPDSSTGDSSKSWTVTTDSKADNANPTVTSQSHTQSGDRTVDARSLQIRGPDGSLNPYQDTETETVRVNATTKRSTTRTFVQDGNGAKTLFQITEEERQTLPGGASRVIRSTSNPDANGNLQLVRREVQEMRKTSPNVEETKTTVMLPNVDGGLAPAMQTQERQERSGDTVQVQKTTLLSDGSGSWQVGEARQETIKGEDQNRSREERVSRPDSEGRLEEITHTVSKESEDVSGEKHNSEETYSIDVAGTGRDSNLHLVQRVTTTQRTNSGSQQTTQRVEQANAGDPSAGLRVTVVTTDTVRSGPSGAQATRTTQVRDDNGSLGVISVDMTKSDSVQAIEVQIAPSKPK